ncbi:M28 family peptidase [Microcoleus sp. FACHB-1515]|uniref:M28 family peptidase n=1 Tax=Cyanophyceae TaxID=3028117 RepID=UPI0016835A64|nr:M28 family peptidase [Microcoleus sp. FACHB-1515]MBD2092040.1 M28 family peptidase [Microcoleus sp. FACHB-1515]
MNGRLQFVRSKRWMQLIVASVGVVGVGLTGCSQTAVSMRQAIDQPNSSAATAPQPDRSAIADAEALVAIGPRVAGTPATEQASRYLEEAFRQAGYATEVQTFTYSKFVDRGSTLTAGGFTLEGRAFNGSTSGNLTASLVAVPNVGRTEDFAQVDVRGAIAIVQRGEIRFLEKANNAARAGAIGLVIVNTEADNFWGTLGGEAAIPVLSLGGAEGQTLLSGSTSDSVTLNVNAIEETVTGRNVIAYMEGVTQPEVLLGAHYDSVAGSPGANDNASGTAVLLDLARQMSDTPLAHQAWFVAFDGEEDGLHGSRSFVRNAQPQFLSQLRAMLNFDMVGINDRLEVSGAESLTSLAKSVDGSIATVGESGGSDHIPFADADVPVLFFTRGMEPNYHSPRDRQVNASLLDETARISIALLERLLTSGS